MPEANAQAMVKLKQHWIRWGRQVATLGVLLALVTVLGLAAFSLLGMTVITLLYMLCVLWAAYTLQFSQAMLAAVIAVMLLNFCFIEPRFTLRIASMQSWMVLMAFAILALTVSRAMQQLKQQMQQAQQAARESAFFQTLAELLTAQTQVDALLDAACQHLFLVFRWSASVTQLTASGEQRWLAGAPVEDVHASSVQWALDYQRAIGAGTADWSTLPVTLLPFAFPQREVLVVAGAAAADMHVLRLFTHQCAQATLQLRQQMALAQAERYAREADFKRTLLTALSHDMRTPLTALLGAVNVLADRDISLSARQSEQLLESMQAEAHFLTQATENILTLVKLEAGHSGLNLDWQSPLEIMQHVAQRYQQRTPSVTLQLGWPEPLPELVVKMDAILVAHALANLIDNALQWRDANTSVTLEMTLEPQHLVLSVFNHGPGFPPGFVITAFAARQQARAGTRGFGLGLSIVQTLMQLHGGALEITRSDDQRTCVRMRFPLSHTPLSLAAESS